MGFLVSAPVTTFAANECGQITPGQENDGNLDGVSCGPSEGGTGVEYLELQDDFRLNLNGITQTDGGVHITDSDDDDPNIIIDTTTFSDGTTNPNVEDDTGLQGALDVVLGGDGSITLNHNVGTFTHNGIGGGNEGEGVYLQTQGGNITVTTADGTTIHSASDDGIELIANAGTADTVLKATLSGDITNNGNNGGDVGIGAIGLNGDGAKIELTLTSTGTINSLGNGIEAQNSGSKNIDVTVDGTVVSRGDGANQSLSNASMGVYTNQTGTGVTTINLNGGNSIGTIDAGGQSNDHGIMARGVDGNVNVSLNNAVSGNTVYEPSIISGGHGVFTQVTGLGNTDILNEGHIEADQDGVRATTTGTGTITVRNNSTSSIISNLDGIHAEGNGGTINIYNGDGSSNLPPLPSNADGFIDADENGIWAENLNGGDINVYNGLSANSNSEIYAGGEYGIYARSRSDGAGTAAVNAYNLGYIETWNSDADAGIYARTTADVDNSYAYVGNGYGDEKMVYAYNARVNAFDFDIDDNTTPNDASDDTATTTIYDANGIEVVKMGGTGGYGYTDYYSGTGEAGVWVDNYGMWDFTGGDDYRTPGFAGGNRVADGTGAATTGGVFAPGGSAVLVRNFSDSDSLVWNFGTMIGEGSNGDPVLDIQTEDFGDNIFYIYNSGVAGSEAIPFNWDDDFADAISEVDYDLNPNIVFRLVDSGQLEDFADASNDQLVVAESSSGGDGADGVFWNDAGSLAVGQVELRTDYGTEFFNNGTWFTRGTSQFYGSNDVLHNYGLIQASFIADANSDTEFRSLNQTYNAGIISLMDGGAGDDLDIDGDYEGGDFNGYGYGYDRGFFALDVFFDDDDSGNGDADEFDIDGDVAGSTGLIIRKANLDVSDGFNRQGIDVVEYDDGDGSIENPCAVSGPCVDGDAFYISEFSEDYANMGGVGVVEDGFFAWYLMQDTEYDDFELQSTLGPGAINAPGIATGAQNIFYDTLSVVDDHVYGQQFAGAGGGGADLPVEAPVYDAPVATSSGTQTGLWVKGGGSWIERDTDVVVDGIGTVATGGDQDIYSILGGADMKWSPDSPFRFGVFGGYVTSSLDFNLGGGNVDYEGGVVGGYGAYNNGAFYADVTVKGDILSADYSVGGADIDADVTNVGVAGNTGYRMQAGNGFIEPIASIAYVHTEVDDLESGGATIEFSESDSLRAGAGGRVGVAFATGGATTELSLLGKVWNEFNDANEVTVDDGVNPAVTFSDDIEGIFGEVAATATVTSADGTLSGFLQANGQFGDDFTSYGAKAGVRKGF